MIKNSIKVGLLIAAVLAIAGMVMYMRSAHQNGSHDTDLYHVSFDESMKLKHYPERLSEPHNQQLYDLFKANYEKNHPTKMLKEASTKSQIPKIIHQIWLGSPFPEKYRAFQASWQKYHPEWEYRLWTEKELADFPMQNRELYEASCNYGEKSDIARYEILNQLGGLYVDTDFECLQPFDTLHRAYNFFIGVQPLDTACVQLGIGLIGSVPGHPLMRCCVANLRENSKHTQQIIARTGPLYFTRVFAALAGHMPDGTVALPASFVYPMAYGQAGMSKNIWCCPESLAVHHWEGSWMKKEAFVS